MGNQGKRMTTISAHAISEHLLQISYLFGKAKEPWKSRAFNKVASEINASSHRFQMDKIDEIPGVGKAVRDVILEFVATGTSRKMEKLKELLPNETVERFDAGVCKRKVRQILDGLDEMGIDWDFAGSARRGSKTLKDVDVIVCISDESERAIIKEAIKRAGLKADKWEGQEKVGISVPIKSQGRSFMLDLNFTTPESRGAHYLYFTGPKSFNVEQRKRAKTKGLRLNQKGLFDKDGNQIAGMTEKQIFEALGEEYVSPEKRA